MATYTMPEFKKKLNRWAERNPQSLKISLRKGVGLVRLEAVDKHLSGPKMATGKGDKKNATLARGSGDLASKLNTRVKATNTKIAASLGSNLKYARIHEKGGVIKPKKKKSLRFKIGGNWVIVKQVTIPARPYLSPSLKEKKKDVYRMIERDMVAEYNRS